MQRFSLLRHVAISLGPAVGYSQKLPSLLCVRSFSSPHRAFREGFTVTLVSGRTVGIGAYLARLGRRCVQRSDQPIILTGFQALNKVLGKQVSIGRGPEATASTWAHFADPGMQPGSRVCLHPLDGVAPMFCKCPHAEVFVGRPTHMELCRCVCFCVLTTGVQLTDAAGWPARHG